jgi:hypothetical protein
MLKIYQPYLCTISFSVMGSASPEAFYTGLNVWVAPGFSSLLLHEPNPPSVRYHYDNYLLFFA